jgi:hypothetical protein
VADGEARQAQQAWEGLGGRIKELREEITQDIHCRPGEGRGHRDEVRGRHY